MKRITTFIFLIAFLAVMIMLSSCGRRSDNNESITDNEFEISTFSEELRNYISIEIDETSIRNNTATVKIVQPDFIKIFDEVIALASSEQEAELLSTMINNLGKYTTEKHISTEVVNNGGTWQLKTSSEVEIEVQKSLDEFLKHFLLQGNFDKIDWEVAQ